MVAHYKKGIALNPALVESHNNLEEALKSRDGALQLIIFRTLYPQLIDMKPTSEKPSARQPDLN